MPVNINLVHSTIKYVTQISYFVNPALKSNIVFVTITGSSDLTTPLSSLLFVFLVQQFLEVFLPPCRVAFPPAETCFHRNYHKPVPASTHTHTCMDAYGSIYKYMHQLNTKLTKIHYLLIVERGILHVRWNTTTP